MSLEGMRIQSECAIPRAFLLVHFGSSLFVAHGPASLHIEMEFCHAESIYES